jgi:purine-binding chemotaxis protein CheW
MYADFDRFVTFRLGTVFCALPQAAVHQILPLPELARPPGLPAPVAGFARLAGAAVPVVRLARLFGLETSAATDEFYAHLLVVGADAEAVALLVDRALDVVQVPPDDLRPVERDETLNGCVEAQFTLGETVYHLLAADRLLLAEERARLRELQEAGAARLDAWTQVPAAPE